jgi:hypothetical protein
MARVTIKELEAENQKLQAEIELLKNRLTESIALVLDALDSANATVSRHLHIMKVQETDYESHVTDL